MKMTVMLQGAGLAAALVFANAAAANILILSPLAAFPTTLTSGDLGEIPIAAAQSSGPLALPQDWFFNFTGSGPLSATVSSIELPIAPGFNFSIADITATLVDLSTPIPTSFGGSSATVEIPDAQPGKYELQINGTVDGTLGGLYSGAVASVAAVPIPNAAWLFLSGVAGVAALSRRRPQRDVSADSIA